MDKYIGRLLDNRYEILESIGTGGMAVVYKARCHRLNRLVAIKILKDDYLEDEDFRRRFHTESQAVAMLSHPNIVSVYDVSTSVSMEADYIVMELIEGITLKQYMEKKGCLNWKETLHFAMQIAKALEHAHSRGVVHRDIKPHNVMVLKNGSVKVADFGIARMMSKGDTLTKEALGSVHYISPEQAKGGRVDNRSDIYSLGVVMYEMMSGRPPYEGDSPVAVAIQHINGGAIAPSALNPNIPGGMEQIIMKAMAHELKDRYETATQMLADMEEFRQNPAMVFGYKVPEAGPARHTPKAPIPFNPDTPKTAAERMEQRQRARQNSRQQAQKRKPESRGSKAATAAIIACSMVAILAIVLFLIFWLNGGMDTKPHTVEVPLLAGKSYDIIENKYDDFVLEKSTYLYDAELEEGYIIEQNPAAGTHVVPGTKIYLTLSKGPAPEELTMPNLTGLTENDVRNHPDIKALSIQIEVYRENGDTQKDRVIRSEPAYSEPITAGQTVKIWISLGPDETVEKKGMPNLVGQDLEKAITILQTYGFPEPEYELVFSIVPEGKVVTQSIDKNKKVPLTTVVKLEVSKGPEPTTQPATTEPEPTEPPTSAPPVEPDPTEEEIIFPEDGE